MQLKKTVKEYAQSPISDDQINAYLLQVKKQDQKNRPWLWISGLKALLVTVLVCAFFDFLERNIFISVIVGMATATWVFVINYSDAQSKNEKRYPAEIKIEGFRFYGDNIFELVDDFDESILICDESKGLYKSVMSQNRGMYHFEAEILLDLAKKRLENAMVLTR